MDHSVTKCNLQTEMSSIKSPQKLMTQDTSVNRNVTEFVDSDEDSNISLTKNSNFNKMFSRVNLREAMLKQAKIINKKVKTTVDSQTYLKQAISTHTKNQQSNLSKMIIYSNSLNTSNDNEMTDLEDLEKHKSKTLKTDKLHLVDLTKVLSLVKKQSLPTSSNNEKAYVISETLHKRNAIVDEVKLESPTTTTSVLNQTLFVRKPLKPTKIMNVLESNGNKPKLVSVRSLVRPSSRVIPYTIPRSKTSTEQDTNKVNVNTLLQPKSHQQMQTDKVNSSLVKQTMQHKFPKSITVKSIPLSTADREKIQYKPFRANIGGRFVTLRRMIKNDTGASNSPCSSKQETTKMCVKKASDGTYRVTSSNDINTNVLTIKKFKSNNQTSEFKKVEPPSDLSSDEDNQPSTSNAAYKRNPATVTLSSIALPKEISDEEQFVMTPETMPTKQKTLFNDREKQIGPMLKRNACFVIPKPQDPTKRENVLYKPKLQNGLTMRRNTSLFPDHTNYTIPQNMLTSSNVALKVSASSSKSVSNQSVSSTTSPTNGEDLFMIQEDSNQNQESSRRKSSLEPMDTFDEDSEIERIKEPLNIPARPRQNTQLIESLARYRTIVRFMLNHLQMQQIDFNNDDYINLYKFYRG